MNSPQGDPPSDVKQRFLAEYERHASRLYLVAYGILRNADDARDATQEAAMKVYQRLEFLRDMGSLGGYLRTTTRNVALDILRRRKRVQPDELVERVPSDDPEIVHSDEIEQLEQAFALLSLDYQEVLYLRYKEGLGAKEIATRLGITHVNARARLSRAHRHLRRELKEMARA